MDQLQRAADIAPYEAVREKLDDLTNREQNLRRTFMGVLAEIDEQRGKFEAARLQAEEIAGRELPNARLLVDQSMRAVYADLERRYPNIEGKLAELQHGRSVVEALFKLAGISWPLPAVRYPDKLPEIAPVEEAAADNNAPEPKVVLPGIPTYSDATVYTATKSDIVPVLPTFVPGPALPWTEEDEAAVNSPSQHVVKTLLSSYGTIWSHRTLAEKMQEDGLFEGEPLDYIENRVRSIISIKDNRRRLRRNLLALSAGEDQAPTVELQVGTCHRPGVRHKPHQVYRVLELTDQNRVLLTTKYPESQSEGWVITWEPVTVDEPTAGE